MVIKNKIIKKIKKFFDSFIQRIVKNFVYQPNDEEEKIIGIITDLMNDESTEKIMAADGKCFFSNKKMNIQLGFDGMFLVIMKDNNCFEYFCRSCFASFINAITVKKIEDDIRSMQNNIHSTKIKILDNIKIEKA